MDIISGLRAKRGYAAELTKLKSELREINYAITMRSIHDPECKLEALREHRTRCMHRISEITTK